MRIFQSVVLAAALLPGLALAQGAPARKAGHWQMTVQVSAPMRMTNTFNTCVDPDQDKDGAAFNGQPQRGGMTCKPGPTQRTPAGWSFSSTCSTQGMTIATTGVASGDFGNNYRVEATTRMTPAPMPQMAETKTVLTGKFMGPCPSGRRPGQVW